MSKKMKVLVSVLVAIILLTVGGTTIALAQDEEELEEDELAEEVEGILPDEESDSLLARVAGILGISEEELREAFRQAGEEAREERFDEALYSMLDKAVEEGLLSDDEAQEIKEWWEERPEALNAGLLQRALWAMHPRLKPMPGNRFGNRSELKLHLQQRLGRLLDPEVKQKVLEKVLEKALEKGLISPEEVEAIKKWLESRPEVSDRFSPRIFKAFRNRQQIAVPQGWHGQTPGEVEA